MRRLFVFGCSFTNYEWPTWADLLGLEFEQYENWALPGIGNRAIAERLAECHARNNITEHDTVIVQWSSHIRHDWYKEYFNKEENAIDGWAVHHTSEHYVKHKKNIDALFSEKGYVLHTLNMITLAQALLTSTGCKWLMTSLGDIRNMGYDNVFTNRSYIGATSDTDTLELIKTVNSSSSWLVWEKFPEFKIYAKIWDNENWLEPMFKTVRANKDKIWIFEKDGYIDLHPTPYLHNEWLTQNLKPKLSITYNYDSARNIIVEKFNQLKASGKYSCEEFFDLSNALIKKLIKDKNIPLLNKDVLTGF
jgi:hypothetical protein